MTRPQTITRPTSHVPQSKTFAWRALFLGLFALLSTACRGGSGPADGPRDAPHALCALYARCESTLGRYYSSEAVCQQQIAAALASPDYAARPALAAHAEACIVWAVKAACTELGVDTVTTPCDRMLSLLPDIGESCASRHCAGDAFCLQPTTSMPWRCPICTARKAPGEPCSSSFECASEICDPHTRTCGQLLPLCALCSAHTDCASRLCLASTGTDPCGGTPGSYVRKCAEPLATGAACSGDAACASYLCDSVSKLCVAPGPIGAACRSHASCVSHLCDSVSNECVAGVELGSACVHDWQCAALWRRCRANVCVGRSLPGEPCTWFDDCVQDAQCVDGLCVAANRYLPAALGEPCLGSCLAGAQCLGTCRTAHALGEECLPSGLCVPGTYCETYLVARPVCVSSKAEGAACSSSAECQSLFCTGTAVCGPVDSCVMPGT